MATLATAERKYADKTKVMARNYFEGVGAFLGASSDAVSRSGPGQNYAGKVKPELAAKWARNLRAAFGV